MTLMLSNLVYLLYITSIPGTCGTLGMHVVKLSS